MSEVSQYLYVLRAIRLQMVTESPTPEESDIISEHFQYLERLTNSGTVILYGRTQNSDETTFGIVVFEAGSEQEAREIMQNDPAVSGGIMTAELFPYRVALMRKPQPGPEGTQ